MKKEMASSKTAPSFEKEMKEKLGKVLFVETSVVPIHGTPTNVKGSIFIQFEKDATKEGKITDSGIPSEFKNWERIAQLLALKELTVISNDERGEKWMTMRLHNVVSWDEAFKQDKKTGESVFQKWAREKTEY